MNDLPLSKISRTQGRLVSRRARGVKALMQQLQTIAPWLQESDLPVLRGFAELEYLARRVFALIREGGILTDKGDGKRLLDQYRSLRATQAQIAAALGLTPMARRELTSKGEGGFDFVVEMTKAIDEARNAEPVDSQATSPHNKAQAIGAPTDPEEPHEQS